MRQVFFFFLSVFFQSTSSADSLTVSVQPPCAVACISICAHVKNPKRWQPHHCLDTRKMSTFSPDPKKFQQQDLDVIRAAETLLSRFLVEHNIALSAADHASKLFQKSFSGIRVAHEYGCCRTKTTAIHNPFTAPACKISRLNDARTRLQTVYFPVL